jgi:hypothetical protein
MFFIFYHSSLFIEFDLHTISATALIIPLDHHQLMGTFGTETGPEDGRKCAEWQQKPKGGPIGPATVINMRME